MGILEEINEEDSYLFEEGLSDDEFSDHHVIPATIRKVIKQKIKEGFSRKKGKKNIALAIELNELFGRIEVDKTRRVQTKLHENYNIVFKGDSLPTEVLGRLSEILKGDYSICGKKNGKVAIARFFFYASKFNGIKYSREEIEAIDRKLEKKCIFLADILVLFKIKIKDIEYYLKENFLYPGYYRFYDVWDALSKNGHKKERRGAIKYHQKFIDNRK